MDVTIIIPIYNSSKYLRRCFDSLIIQSGVSMEFICVDDGSTDSSLSICKEYVSKDDRFRFIHMKHRGVSAARNAGLEAASGRYVWFVDSDDSIRKGAVKRLFDIAEADGCDCVKFNAKLIHGKRWMRDSFRRHDELIEDFHVRDIFRYNDCRPFIWAHLIRRSLIQDMRFNESLVLGEDQKFIIRYLSRASRR